MMINFFKPKKTIHEEIVQKVMDEYATSCKNCSHYKRHHWILVHATDIRGACMLSTCFCTNYKPFSPLDLCEIIETMKQNLPLTNTLS